MDTEQSTYRATNDAYTGMLAISLIAMIVGSALLFLDYSQYPDGSPPKVPTKASAQVAPTPPAEKAAEPKDDDKKGETPADEKKE